MSSMCERIHQLRFGDIPHAVYRCFDEDGRLLYVGCTYDPEVRWQRWRHSKADWPAQVTRRTVEWFPTYWEARRAETSAIVSENPVHNVRQRGPRPAPPRPPEEQARRARSSEAYRVLARARFF